MVATMVNRLVFLAVMAAVLQCSLCYRKGDTNFESYDEMDAFESSDKWDSAEGSTWDSYGEDEYEWDSVRKASPPSRQLKGGANKAKCLAECDKLTDPVQKACCPLWCQYISDSAKKAKAKRPGLDVTIIRQSGWKSVEKVVAGQDVSKIHNNLFVKYTHAPNCLAELKRLGIPPPPEPWEFGKHTAAQKSTKVTVGGSRPKKT